MNIIIERYIPNSEISKTAIECVKRDMFDELFAELSKRLDVNQEKVTNGIDLTLEFDLAEIK